MTSLSLLVCFCTTVNRFQLVLTWWGLPDVAASMWVPLGDLLNHYGIGFNSGFMLTKP